MIRFIIKKEKNRIKNDNVNNYCTYVTLNIVYVCIIVNTVHNVLYRTVSRKSKNVMDVIIMVIFYYFNIIFFYGLLYFYTYFAKSMEHRQTLLQITVC